MNILIVDDSSEFRAALRFMLEENFPEQCKVIHEAGNGKECLEIIGKQPVDIVFMDKQMPIMDGVTATKQIVDQFRNIKVIAVSFHSELENIRSMLEAGARNYLIKEEISTQTVKNCLKIT